MSKGKKQENRYPTLTLLDEAFGLLRERWLSFGVPYLAGSVPFFGFLIYYVEDASFGSGDLGRIAIQSIVLASLFFWMKTWHCFACQDLRNALRADRQETTSVSDFVRIGLLQTRLQGYASLGLILSSLFVAPFGWVFAYSQFLSAVGIEKDNAKDRRERAWRAAKSLSQPIHLFLAVYTVVWLIVWINTATLVYFVPELLRMFFGIENVMAQRGWNLFNTTFFVVSLSGAAMISDALAKSYFTKLLYKNESVRSGHDILSKFTQSPILRSSAMLAIVFLCVCPALGNAKSEDSKTTTAVTEYEIQEMKMSIEKTLSESEISWRMKRVSKEETADEGFLEAAFERMVEIASYAGKKIGDFFDWLLGRKDRTAPPLTQSSSGGGTDGFLRLLVFLGISIIVFLVLWLIISASTRKPIEPKEDGIDQRRDLELSDESVHAALLPSERWMSLAREKAEAGDFRLAIRAVFLATLALLGSKQLLVLAKHKSNLDYAYELSNRGLANEGRVQFNTFRNGFDRVWYGNYAAAESMYLESIEHFQRLDDISGK